MKLFITDQRMLDLMEWAIGHGIATNETEYLESIKFSRTNISNLRKGIGSFTKEHIYNACKITGASADYLFGFTNVMKRKPARKAIELLSEAVEAVKQELS